MTKLEKEAMLKPEQLAKLKELFPQAVVDGKVDFVILKALLGEQVEETNEKYQFTWNGKQNAIAHAQKPSLGTLREDKASSKDFDSTENLYIEGDNLEVLKLLQKTYQGKIKMIYIDPPYNTGNDFVYKDDFKDNVRNYLELTNQKNKSNAETSGRYHTDWLNMMYPRLMLARNLLTDDGVIFISIDEYEIANLLKITSEIFGEENHIENFVWIKNATKNNSKTTSTNHEYLLCFSKSINVISSKNYFRMKKLGFDEIISLIEKARIKKQEISYVEQEISEVYKKNIHWKGITSYKYLDNSYNLYSSDNMSPPGGNGYDFDILHPLTKKPCKKSSRGWLYSKEKISELILNNKILFGKDENSVPRLKKFLTEVMYDIYTSVIEENLNGEKEVREIFGIDKSPFENPKPTKLLSHLLNALPNDSIVLDFFSGSGTTAHAVMKLNAEDGGNRKFIMVQLPEKTEEDSEAYKAGYKNICEIGKERIRRAGEKVKQEMLEKDSSSDVSKLDVGFKVFKLDSTNIKPWDGTQDINQMLIEAAGNVVKKDRTDLDVVHELMLMYGVFNEEVEEIKINGKTLYSIGENFLVVCLFQAITKKDIEEIIKLKPKNVIFNDAGFENDNVKINAELTLKNHGVEDIKSL